MTSNARRVVISRLNQEGRDARIAGIKTVPRDYRNNMNAMHWRDGWNAQNAEMEASESDDALAREIEDYNLMEMQARNEYLVRTIHELKERIAALERGR